MSDSRTLLFMALLLLVALVGRRWIRSDGPLRTVPPPTLALGGALAVMALTIWVWHGLRAPPVVDDEAAYVLQADLFAHGRWKRASPQPPEAFTQPAVLVTPVLAPKMAPGHAMLLAPGVAAGVPGLVPVLLSGATAALIVLIVCEVQSPAVAVLTIVLWITAAGQMRWRASYFSEITTGALWMLGWYALLRWRRSRHPAWLLILAAATGWGAITRPLTMLAFAIPVGVSRPAVNTMLAARIGHLRLRSWSALALGLAVATAAVLAGSIAASWRRPPLTPDSWSYLLLARSFHGAPYRMTVLRQYWTQTDYTDAFPPGWPLLLAAVGDVVAATPWLGIEVAALLALLLLPLLAQLLRPVIRARGRRRVVAVAAWASVLSFSPFLDEILSGRSMAAAMLGYVALATVVLRGRATVAWGAAAGLVAGLLWMTRFDAAPVVAVILVAAPLSLTAGSHWRWRAAFVIVLGIVLVPWIVYSRRHFSTSFATAPSALARSAAPGQIADWHPLPPAGFAAAPRIWLARVAGNIPGVIAAVERALLRYGYAAVLAVFAIWTAVQRGNLPGVPARAGRVGLVFGAALAAQLAGPLLIGVFDLRYFTPLILAIAVWSLSTIATSRRTRFRGMLAVPLIAGLLLGWRKEFRVQRAQRDTFIAAAAPDRLDRWPSVEGVPTAALRRCLPPTARTLVLADGDPAYLIGYYSDRLALTMPDNWRALSEPDRNRFLAVWRVTHVLTADSSLLPRSADPVTVQGCAPLRRVALGGTTAPGG